jgi:hypothetical protein
VESAFEADGHHAAEEASVLDDHRVVEAHLFSNALDLVGRRLRPRDQASRLSRDEEEDDVRDDRDGEEENARPQESSDQIPVHSRRSWVW